MRSCMTPIEVDYDKFSFANNDIQQQNWNKTNDYFLTNNNNGCLHKL